METSCPKCGQQNTRVTHPACMNPNYDGDCPWGLKPMTITFDVDNFPVSNSLKHTVSELIVADMAQYGYDLSERQQQNYQDKHATDLINAILDEVLKWQQAQLPTPTPKGNGEEAAKEIESKIESILEKVIDDFIHRWKGHREHELGMAKAKTDICNLINIALSGYQAKESEWAGKSKKGMIGKKPYRYKALKVFGRRVDEHRYVMELHLGRYLTGKEIVRHKNDDPKDNRLENLYITDRKGQVLEQIQQGNFHTAEGSERGRIKSAETARKKFGKKVWICDIVGNELMLVASVAIATKVLKANRGHVGNVLRGYGNCKTVFKYTLKYLTPIP